MAKIWRSQLGVGVEERKGRRPHQVDFINIIMYIRFSCEWIGYTCHIFLAAWNPGEHIIL